MNGAAIAVSETFRTSKNRSFVVDSAGRILQKTENGGTQNYFYANDKPVGSSGALAAADFDYNYTPVTEQYPALVPGNYVVSAGDTLRGIALAVYGDAQLWYLIADANGLQTDAELTAGRNLTIPNKITNLRNAYDTYKPYEPGRIVGDLTPTLPEPPPPPAKKDGGGCGGLGRIIMLAVQIVVSYLIPGPIGAMIGNLAGQVVGNVLGVQDGISWKEVAKAGLSSFIGGQLGAEGSPLAGSDFPTVVARAAVSNALTQGISVAVGLQDKFDWKGVAAAAVGAGVSHVVGNAIGESQYGEERWAEIHDKPNILGKDFGNTFSRELVTGFASGIAKQVVYGGKANWANIIADAFGNALGNSLAYAATAVASTAQQTQGIGPWSAADYRNGMDIESDLAASRRENPSGWAFADDVAWRRAALANVWSNPAAAGIDTPPMSGPPAPVQIQAGAAAAKGFWGVAAEQLGPGATNAEIQDYAQRMMSVNPGVRFDRMRTDTVLTLPDENTSTSAAARREWERSNALAAAREQEWIEAAQRAAANELRRETSRGAILAAVSSAPALPIASIGGDVAPSEFEVSMGLGQTGQAFHGSRAEVNAALAAFKDNVQSKLAEWGGAAERQGGALGYIGHKFAGFGYVGAEIILPSNDVEAGLVVVSPAIGKAVGAGVRLLNTTASQFSHTAWLASDVFEAGGRVLWQLGETASYRLGRGLDNLGLTPGIVENTGVRVANTTAAAEEAVVWNRLNTVGRTPGKTSPTGQAVVERMRAEGSFADDPVLGQMFKGSDGEWYPTKLADMSHKTDAVTWWNSTGRTFGAKSPEVRNWMLDPNNYVLDYYSINRRQGALLGNSGVRYLPPLK